MKKFLTAVVALVSMIACLSGCKGRGSDTIRISESDVTVNADAQTITLYTEGKFNLTRLYYSTDKDGVEIYDSTIDDGVSNEEEYDYTGPWFTISTGNNRRTITITLQENTSGIARRFRVELNCGDYYQWLYVEQSPE